MFECCKCAEAVCVEEVCAEAVCVEEVCAEEVKEEEDWEVGGGLKADMLNRGFGSFKNLLL